MFRAYDPERERLVAIKLFKLDLPPERVHQLVAVFERLIAADLTHPALSAPLATGMADLSAYLVQDYIVAESMDQAVREHGPAAPSDALRIAAQLADALDFTAAVNILHGALHPRDVLLSSEETRLSGVGIARALEQVGSTAPIRRPYTAPERMAAASWDRRADVFSLAALLHELLWGRRVSGFGKDAAATLTPIEGGDQAALKSAFGRALAENPEQRFPTALEFADALARAFPDVIAIQPAIRGSHMEDEPRLPLDVFEPETPGTEIAPSLAPHPRSLDDDDDVPLKPSAAQYEDLDATSVEAEAESVDEEEPVAGPAGLITGYDTAAPSAIDRARSAVWPLVLALTVGLAMGFAGGYGVGSHDRAPVGSAGREFTENPVTEAPKKDVETAPAAAVRPKPETTPAATAGATAAAASGRLLIRSTPEGASVTVDGREYGQTPATVRDLPHGPHNVRLTRDGYAAYERRVVLSSSRPAQSVNAPMVRVQAAPSRVAASATPTPAGTPTTGRAAGALAVDSRPTGAKVFLDGKLIGSTPLMVPSVPAGDHTVRLELDGYQPWSSSVRMVAAEGNRVTASLER